jgi:hypothetical protein
LSEFSLLLPLLAANAVDENSTLENSNPNAHRHTTARHGNMTRRNRLKCEGDRVGFR